MGYYKYQYCLEKRYASAWVSLYIGTALKHGGNNIVGLMKKKVIHIYIYFEPQKLLIVFDVGCLGSDAQCQWLLDISGIRFSYNGCLYKMMTQMGPFSFSPCIVPCYFFGSLSCFPQTFIHIILHSTKMKHSIKTFINPL